MSALRPFYELCQSRGGTVIFMALLGCPVLFGHNCLGGGFFIHFLHSTQKEDKV